MEAPADAAVELRGITKRFPGVVANRDVNIAVRRGHGARHRRRERRRQVDADEDPVRHAAPRRGHDRGQRQRGHLPLARRRDRRRHRHGAPALHAGRQPHRAGERRPRQRADARPGSLDFGGARKNGSRRSPTRYGLDVDPDALVEDLGVGDRQRVEILKVLYRGAQILILDEPTAVLVPQEVDELFDNLRELKPRGPHDHLHLAQARRGARGRRRDHRDPARHHRRHRGARRASPPASSPS